MTATIFHHLQAAGASGVLFVYLLLHLCVGALLPYRRSVRPFLYRLAEKLGRVLEQRLNRPQRPPVVRLARGAVVALLMAWIGWAFGYLVAQLAAVPVLGWVLQLFVLSLCIGMMGPFKLGREVASFVRAARYADAADALQPYVDDMVDGHDRHAGARRMIEFIASSLAYFLVSPALWFLAAGPEGVVLCTVFAALACAFAVTDPRHRYFNMPVRVVDFVLNVFPALLTALLIALATLAARGARLSGALALLIAQGWRGGLPHPSGPVAAMAGALGVTLGGGGRGWVGDKDATARVSATDLTRALVIEYAIFLAMILLSGVLVFVEIKS